VSVPANPEDEGILQPRVQGTGSCLETRGSEKHSRRFPRSEKQGAVPGASREDGSQAHDGNLRGRWAHTLLHPLPAPRHICAGHHVGLRPSSNLTPSSWR